MSPHTPLPDPDAPVRVPPRPPLPDVPVPPPAVTEPLSTVVREPDATTLPLPQITPATVTAAPGAASPPPGPLTDAAPTRRAGASDSAASDATRRRRSVPGPPKKRRRGLRAALGTGIPVAVIAVLAVVGWFAGNAWAHTAVVDGVTQHTRQALQLPSGHPVDVTVRDPMLPQLIRGTLSTLTVHVADTPLIRGGADLTLTATGVPVRGSGAAHSATARVSFPLSDVGPLAGSLGRTVPGSLHIVDGDVVVSLDPSQFLSGVSFALTLHPSVSDGELVLTPTGFDVGNMSMPADVIRARFGSLAPGILAPRRVCVASAFPQGLTLTSLTLGTDRAAAGFRVDPRVLTDTALQRPGTCP